MRCSAGQLIALLLALSCSNKATAYTYAIDGEDDYLIGQVQRVQAEYEDTLLDIARAHGLGFNEIKLVNSQVDTWLPGQGRKIVLPTRFVLPQAPRDGMVLNIPEMRLYYFPPAGIGGRKTVITYPLGIGREGWGTPYVKTRIAEKKQNPTWYPPESIRKEHAALGDPLPERVAPGPDNPLGAYAMRLGLPTYLIHGTNKPFGIGMRVSHGCIRLYPEDIARLYARVRVGTPVYIINQPFKLGIEGERIYLEAHPWLDEDAEDFQGNLTSVISTLLRLAGDRRYELNWELAKQIIHAPNGLPVEIGRFLPPGAAVAAAPALRSVTTVNEEASTSTSR